MNRTCPCFNTETIWCGECVPHPSQTAALKANGTYDRIVAELEHDFYLNVRAFAASLGVDVPPLRLVAA